jgi:hypothetical protein
MSSLTPLEKRHFEDIFSMGNGYVLSFTNDSFAQLFRDTVNIQIYDIKYAYNGESKARRLRAFWELESDPLVGKILATILDFLKYENDKKGTTSGNIGYAECNKIINRLLGKAVEEVDIERDFLTKDFGSITFNSLGIEAALIPILDTRIKEANECLKNGLSLSTIFLCGSILEGVLLAIATQYPQKFNQATSSPKAKLGKVKSLHDWYLSNFIDVSCEIGLLGLDVKKFSYVLRDFRNYIHPYHQMAAGFNPDEHTAKICMQVLKAAIADISAKQSLC